MEEMYDVLVRTLEQVAMGLERDIERLDKEKKAKEDHWTQIMAQLCHVREKIDLQKRDLMAEMYQRETDEEEANKMASEILAEQLRSQEDKRKKLGSQFVNLIGEDALIRKDDYVRILEKRDQYILENNGEHDNIGTDYDEWNNSDTGPSLQ